MNADTKLKGEALWTLCNAITGSSPTELMTFTNTYNVDLIRPLCYNLTRLAKSEVGLILAVVESIETLLSLDKLCPCSFGGHGSVRRMVEQCQGFDSIHELQNHPNEGVYKKCHELLQSYAEEEDNEVFEIEAPVKQVETGDGFTFH